jgi:hypothetical protein
MNDQELERLNLVLEQNFGMSTISDQEKALLDVQEQLTAMLAQRVSFFIRTSMDKLLQAFYRLDLSDQDVDQAFDLGDVNKVSRRLAELIIERQLKKIRYAQEFKHE